MKEFKNGLEFFFHINLIIKSFTFWLIFIIFYINFHFTIFSFQFFFTLTFFLLFKSFFFIVFFLSFHTELKTKAEGHERSGKKPFFSLSSRAALLISLTSTFVLFFSRSMSDGQFVLTRMLSHLIVSCSI